MFVKEICNELSSLFDVDEFILKDYSERCKETHKGEGKKRYRGRQHTQLWELDKVQ